MSSRSGSQDVRVLRANGDAVLEEGSAVRRSERVGQLEQVMDSQAIRVAVLEEEWPAARSGAQPFQGASEL